MGQRQTWISSPWVLWGLWIVVFAAFSAVMPRDASYDVAHYHIHNGWSILNNRLDQDLAPAELHSFLNPAYNVIAYWLMERLPGPLVSALLSLPQAFILPALFYLTRNVTRAMGHTLPVWLLFAVAFSGFLSEPTLRLLASVRNDSLGALGLIVAFVLILKADGRLPSPKRLAAASVLVGFLMGLKLTNAVYTAGFAAGVLVMLPGVQARVRGMAVCAGAGLVGTLLGGGPWALTLWQKFGNPYFPMMNGIFKSPQGPDTSFRDTNFLPDSILEGLIRPFQFLFEGKLINEEQFFDPRFQIAYVVALAILGFALFKRREFKLEGARPVIALAFAVLTVIIAWTFMFSIQRYAMFVWLLGPTLFLVALLVFAPKTAPQKPWIIYPAIGMSAILVGVTQTAPMRRAPWLSPTQAYAASIAPDVYDYEDAIIVFTATWPSAFNAVAFPQSATMTHAVVHDWSAPALANYRPQIESLIWETGADRPLYAVVYEGENGDNYSAVIAETLRQQNNLGMTMSQCRQMETTLDIEGRGWLVCPLKRLSRD